MTGQRGAQGNKMKIQNRCQDVFFMLNVHGGQSGKAKAFSHLGNN